ncbi:hypothetical protein HK103_003023 [Boothiomyces macroporosus]|uniref:Sulfatase N-terminal domain-containing protein n=1 Tax=Boothiomyces macroporosus TaxID=261099 RepID=A0AAD5UCD2_9FUNG|nr:hypothetical protein HK103_003023 [Boothiomyces macroporosus]
MLGYLVLGLVKLFNLFLLLTCITAIFVSGAELDVGIIYKVIANWKQFSKMASSPEEMNTMQTIYGTYFVILAIIIWINYLRQKTTAQYISLSTRKPIGKRKIFQWATWYMVYLLGALLIRPLWPYSNMSKYVLFKFIAAPWTDRVSSWGISNTEPDAFFKTDNVDLPIEKVSDFSFLQRTNTSEIKNVLWFTFESARAEVYPFNYNSTFAKRVLTEKAMSERKITPFMDEFVKECSIATGASTAASYTIKSILAMQCSMYPYPSDFISEDERAYYKTCLPTHMKQNGFASIFMEPCTVFDKLDRVLAKMNMSMYGKEEIDKEFKNGAPYDPVNYFGYGDDVMLDRMFAWIEKKVESKVPFYFSSITNTNHHPWNSPKGWEKQDFAKEEFHMSNNYLNTVAYTDTMIKKVVDYLKKKGIANETLLIINGDHGSAFGEQGMVGTTNRLAVTFKVPLILWTDNEKWKPLLKNRKLLGDRTTMDILPTILDVLNDKFTPNTRFDYGYEGDSLVHPPIDKPRFGFSNPGLRAIQVREKDMKMSIDSSGYTSVYNLKTDPDESNPLDLNTYQGGKYSKWHERARALIGQKIRELEKAYGPVNL